MPMKLWQKKMKHNDQVIAFDKSGSHTIIYGGGAIMCSNMFNKRVINGVSIEKHQTVDKTNMKTTAKIC